MLKISVELNNQIKSLLELYKGDKKGLLTVHGNYEGGWNKEFDSINNMSFEELSTVLYGEYEVVKTREEQLKEHYDRLNEINNGIGIRDEHGAFLGQMTGICTALTILGIEIKGINV